jgi:hypothetical protein
VTANVLGTPGDDPQYKTTVNDPLNLKASTWTVASSSGKTTLCRVDDSKARLSIDLSESGNSMLVALRPINAPSPIDDKFDPSFIDVAAEPILL